MSGKRLQPRKEPQQVRGELTRQRILAAAARVFAELGYAAGTTNRIAERARVSIGSLYQYYPNKDAILVALAARHLDAGAETLRRHRETAGPPETLYGALRELVHVAVQNHLDDPQLLRVLADQAPRSAELLEQVARYEEERVASVRELLERSPETRVSNVDMAARIVVNTVELLVHKLIAGPEPLDLPAFEDELTAMLTRYATAGSERSSGLGRPVG
ncbi:MULTISPECIES: TetR/AcrR family transcriptional regulator [Amycolatopsis]|uniref:TetR/AcrR family transcriptional regulator n=1 Tax=Amycolatopsis dendrobii TaxID=2760662 RepID=A0A7W3W066_9PSEU|nr:MULTISPECIES: TetR/AcrR family transcriptional regulator [Amycolatopsis]MBB1156244.1 TetR/AcrR family transcriptional regulator [Amycolatopsis dendrobii]UKD58770.1 TetR/AcrR family transcriptional regulator [Amycolatopsis sp. FU40]